MMNATPWTARWQALVRTTVRVQALRGQAQLLDWLAHPDRPRVLAFINAHAMNAVVEDARFYEALMAADLVLRDGIGMSLLMSLLNQRPGLNLNGTDLIPRILSRFAGAPIALFGTREPWLTHAAQAVVRDFAPEAACVMADGFRATDEYLRLAQAHAPALIILGMGMPRQEIVALALREALHQPCLIVCGGAILDFLGGRMPRAPKVLRSLGLEWAWRLAREPRRLFQRYVVGNPMFIGRALRLASLGWPRLPLQGLR
jgi:N-acetylglucosaminyldiphosphoundecaprenol N-acetyl-beta-D-mannosaminyltransferase